MQNTNEKFDQLSPWLGLTSYSEQHSESFWGRSAEAEQLFYEIYDHCVTIVYGPSGVGKSSLLKAGVFPKLRTKQFFPIYVRLAHNKSNRSYFEQIISTIKTDCEKAFCTIEEIAPLPAEANENLWTWLHRHKFSDVLDVQVRPVLIFDQFEELFTISEKDESEIKNIITQICDTAGDHLPYDLEQVLNKNNQPLPFSATAEYRIVLSLRDDFVSHIDEISHQCPSLRNNRISVKPMTFENAMEVVFNEKTSSIVNQSVAKKIIQAVSENSLGNNKTNSFIEPALLSLFCEQINLCRIKYGLSEITEELVEENKGNILANFYDTAMHKISVFACEKLEDNLISDSGFRLLKAVDDLLQLGIEDSEIKELVNARLLRSDVRNGVHYVELCHDIIIPVIKKKRDARVLNERMKFYRKWCYFAASFIVFICLMLQAGYYLFFKEYKNYYKNMVKIYGAPTGINKLTDEQVKHRLWSFEFRTKGLYDFKFNNWKNFKWDDISTYIPFESALSYQVVLVNSKMQPTTEENICFGTYIWSDGDSSNKNTLNIDPSDMASVVIVEFVYDANRKPSTEIGKNSKGEIVWVCKYMENYTKDRHIYDRENEVSRSDAKNSYGKPEQQVSNFAGVQQETKKTNQTPDSANPAITEKTRIIANKPKTPSVSIQQQYQKISRFDTTVFFTDKYGFPVKFKDERIAPYVGINYDESGNESEWVWINPLKREFTKGLDSAHKRVFRYMDQKNPRLHTSMESYSHNLGTWEKFDDDAGNHKIEFGYDSKGNIVWAKYYNAKGKQIPLHGRDHVKWVYDQYGNITKERSWKGGQKVCNTLNGTFEEIYEYRHGRRLKTTWYSLRDYGINGNKDIEKAELSFRFEKLGKICKLRYLPFKGKKTVVDKNSISHWENIYDPVTQKLKKNILYSQPGYGVWGYKNVMRVEREYNAAGKILTESYFDKDEDGNLTPYEGNVAKIVRTYDSQGRQLTEAYYGKDGKPTVDKNSISHWENIYDSVTKKLKKDILYSLPGYGVWGYKNVMRVEREYNVAGKIIKQSYFDKAGNLTPFDGSVAKIVRTYDSQGRQLTEAYYGEDGKSSAGNKNNVCYEINEYDEKNRLVKNDKFALPGKYILNYCQGRASWVQVTFNYLDDDTYERVEKYYKNAYRFVGESYPQHPVPVAFNNNVFYGIAKIKKLGKDKERILEIRAYTYNKDNEPLLTPYDGNIAKTVRTYDSQGRQLTEAYYGKDGKPTVDKNSISHWENIYDSVTKKLKKDILYSQPGYGVWGYKNVMRVEREYNVAGKIIKQSYFDKAGNLTPFDGSVARVEKTYDSQGRQLTEAYYGKDGKPIVDKNSISHWENIYDSVTKKLKKDILYSLPGYGVWGYKNVMRVEREYDINGNITGETYFAALTGEELAGDNRNICYQKSYFDDKNRLICREHFALREKTILNLPTSKATMWRSSYSYEDGKKIQTEKYFSNAYHDESYWTKYQPEGFGNGVFSGIAEIKTYQSKENGVTTSVDRIVKLTARNAKSDIVPFDGNVAIRIWDYNILGNQTYYENRNSKNELTPDLKGITRCVTEYDSSGKTKKREILYGNNLEGKKGVAKIHREYNSQGKLTEEKYFDKNDKEAALPNGMVRRKISYDESGKNIKMVIIYGQTSIPGTKVARFIRKLNFASQPLEERYYDAQGNPANNIRGIYAISISYDASGKKKLKEIFYGKDIDGRKNITRIEKTFDLNGKILSEKFF